MINSKNNSSSEKKFLRVKKYFLQRLFFTFMLSLFSSLFIYSQEINNESYITTQKSPENFVLCESGRAAPILISANDYKGVIRAAKDLRSDIEKVTNTKPKLLVDTIPSSEEIIIIGTIGKSSTINKLINEGKLEPNDIKGKWEASIIQTVDNPLPNIKRALVIAGSDKRGTIFGIYDVSEKIGVSPWYWWADVPIKKNSCLFVMPGMYKIGPPAVKYRGIFLNDEAPALTGWAHEKFGGLNHNFYEKVFELILRLKGNYLWPAMWSNMFYVDDPLNPKLANEYGVVIGTSHHEPLMRAWKEWEKFGNGPWNYQKNDSVLREYWQKSIKRMNDYESIITLGMRGDGDEPMSENANISLLEKIVHDQRKIIAEVTKKDVTSLPQMWALYKEVQEYYDKGMRVPDDVTLLLCDDNWGNIRKLPDLNAKPRKGGYGIYYHFDYVGGPRNYKWLNTSQIERVWEQMHLAYEYGAKEVWIVNVGDLKPMEFPISFFLDYAWDPDKWKANDLPKYYELWAQQQFGTKYAKDIANIIAKYTKYNSRRKPELLSPDTYSLTNYNEAENVVSDYNKLAEQAQNIYNSISEEYKDAFYQFVLHPVTACANLNELYVAAGKNKLYAAQGRAAANDLAEKVKSLFKKDAEITNYYNNILAGGKWSHMMDQTHIGYTYWQQPDSNSMPEVEKIEIPPDASMGVAAQGSDKWFPNVNEISLLEFDKFNQQSYYIEIFNRGKNSFEYLIQLNEEWVKIDNLKGKIEKQKRVRISIDWEKAPSGKNKAELNIVGPNNSLAKVQILINNPLSPVKNDIEGFVENNKYVSINAEDFSRAVGSSDSKIQWKIIPNLGKTSSAATVFPVTSKSQKPGSESPHLEYEVYFVNNGKVEVQVYLSPTLNFHNTQGLRYAVSFDDENPQIINMHANDSQQVWESWVSNNINIKVSEHEIKKPGTHVLKLWMIDPGVVIQKIVINAGGVEPSYLGPPESFLNTNN